MGELTGRVPGGEGLTDDGVIVDILERMDAFIAGQQQIVRMLNTLIARDDPEAGAR